MGYYVHARHSVTYRIEHVRMAKFGLEVSRTGQHEAGHIRPVVGDE